MSVAIFVEEYPDQIQPLSLTSPVFELRYGRRQLMRILVDRLGEPDAFIVPPRFEEYVREKYPGRKTTLEDLSGRVLVVNASTRPEALDEVLEAVEDGNIVVDGGRLVAAKLDAGGYSTSELLSGRRWHGMEVDALMKGPWELVEALTRWPRGRGVIYGSNVRVEEPVTIDSERGPVLIADDVRIEAFTRIEGPAYIGKGSIIHSARINPYTFIGEACRIGGEVEHSIIADHSNKAHAGYLGHSYVGSWVNIGAGTVTSDLKNTYGTVRMAIGGRNVDTGMIKMGSIIGDHVKIAINTSIYTGRRIGASGHVYGLVDKDVPAFVIYSNVRTPEPAELELGKAIEIAERMMGRRGVSMTPAVRRILEDAFRLSQGERERFLSTLRGEP